MAICSPKFQPFSLLARSRGPKLLRLQYTQDQIRVRRKIPVRKYPMWEFFFRVMNLDTFGYILKF